MLEPEFISALIKAGPVGVAILALGFSIWKWILPAIKELRQMDQAAEQAREAARVARDTAWQASLREIGQSHKEATATAVAGFEKALDRHDKAMDRYAQQHASLAADVGQVKTDVASMRSDLHAAVARLSTLDGIPVVSATRKE